MTKLKQVKRRDRDRAPPNPAARIITPVDSLLASAEAEVDTFNYEKAEELCRNALLIDSENVKGIEMLAGIYIELSKWGEAEELLKRSVELCPDSGHEKYFSLGQMCNGEDSVKLFEKGIKILETKLEDSENEEISDKMKTTEAALRRVLSDAYCSVGEIFMTDCCFADQAEDKCKAAIENAIKSDPSNPEGFQCLTNLLVIKDEFKEAKIAIEKSLSLWLPQHELIRDGEIDGIASVNSQFYLPLYDSRIKASKLLIELEMFEDASKILDGLLEEDDEVLEVWYLLGWLNYLQGEEYKYNSYYFLKKAEEVGLKNGGDVDQMSHIEELLDELKDACPDDEKEKNEEPESYEPESSDSENEGKTMET